MWNQTPLLLIASGLPTAPASARHIRDASSWKRSELIHVILTNRLSFGARIQIHCLGGGMTRAHELKNSGDRAGI